MDIKIENIDFGKVGGLVPAIVQDARTRVVLMMAYMNEEALRKTLAEGRVTFYSRSRHCLWTKGETSGHYLDVVDIKADCDNDTLLVEVTPHGAACHKGTDTCWGESNEGDPLLFLSALQDLVSKRREEMPEGSYTTSLFKDGINRMAQKVGEEAIEMVIEACNGTRERVVYEGADLLYHLIVLLTSQGLRIEDIARELRQRHDPTWHKH